MIPKNLAMRNCFVGTCVAGALSAVAILVAAVLSSGGAISVRDFNAVGDGVANDGPAIARAVSALSSQHGGTLLFPAGTYRDTSQGSAIILKGISGVRVRFDDGAQLVMDNLDSAGHGTGHGILIQGPAARISIINPSIKWAHVPSSRSNGDGIRFEGYPSDAQTISDIRVTGAHVESAPQTGMIVEACSDVFVTDFSVSNNLADGLHFNACRRVHVSGVDALNTGDDSLAFVTYYNAKDVNVYPGTTGGPYAQPAPGDWSNSQSVATNITTRNSRANGVRISGANGLAISNVSAVNSASCGVQFDSAIANGSSIGWSYQASQGVTLNGLTVDGASTGLLGQVLGATYASDPSFWTFGVVATGINAKNCSNDAINVSNADGWSLGNARAAGRCRFIGSRNLVIAGLFVTGGPALFYGTPGAKVLDDYMVGHVVVVGGTIGFQDLTGSTAGPMTAAGITYTRAPVQVVQTGL